MTLDKSYLDYPYRKPGMDHNLYSASNLFKRPKVRWPGGKKLALWITVSAEYFPLTPNEGSFRAPGAMITPFPDYRTYTTKDYGNRVGIYRIIRELERAGVPATLFLSSSLFSHARSLIADLKKTGWEFAAHGVDMNHLHHGGLSEDQEREMVKTCLNQFAAQDVIPKGWLSPARSESLNTPRLLQEAGLHWHADWGNDDMPYKMSSGIVSMPFTDEIEDRKCLNVLGQREDVWEDQVLEAFAWLHKEASTYGGRILHIALTPYVIGQPFRIKSLRNVLEKLPLEDCWPATGSEIFAAWSAAED